MLVKFKSSKPAKNIFCYIMLFWVVCLCFKDLSYLKHLCTCVTIVRIKNPGLEVYCHNFLLTFSLLITKVKGRFAQFLITLPNTTLGIGSLFNHMIKKRAKQTNSYTQVRVVNNRKKQKASRPGFFIRTMLSSSSIWSDNS